MPSPQKITFILGLEMRILVHFPALLNVCVCTASIRPGIYLEYACPVWHSRLTVSQSKTLEFLQKRASNVYLPSWKIRSKFNHCQRRNIESR